MLAPRDLYTLRSLGQAYVAHDPVTTERVLDEIVALDEHAFEENAECAGLKGRWLLGQGRREDARDVYAAALRRDPESHYLAGRLAQTLLDLGARDEAKKAYGELGRILHELNDQNVWTHSDAATAAVVVGDLDEAAAHLSAIIELRPSKREWDRIVDGLSKLLSKLDLDQAELDKLRSVLPDWVRVTLL